MVTNRRRGRNGSFGSEQEHNWAYYCMWGYNGGPQGERGFGGTEMVKPKKRVQDDDGGKRQDRDDRVRSQGERAAPKFKAELLKELIRIKAAGHTSTPKVGIYIHGYNNDFQDSIDEIVDLEESLTDIVGYAPVVIGFSWPSMGLMPAYISDREEVRDAVPAFTRFLLDLDDFLTENEGRCFSTTYCMPHSLGNYLLRKGMEYASDKLGTPVSRKMFDETVLIGSDIASKDVEMDGKGRFIAQFSRRVHIYYSKHDRALKASTIKRFGQNRLGRHGPNDYDNLAPNVVAIDCRKFSNKKSLETIRDSSGDLIRNRKGKPHSIHSSYRYHPRILRDIVDVISSHDRSVIPGRKLKAKPLPGREPNNYKLVADDRDPKRTKRTRKKAKRKKKAAKRRIGRR